jgi:hypothetical protein
MSDKVLIRYKSGQSQTVTCDGMTVKKSGGKIVEMNWNNMQPNPLFINLDDIESVWELS